MSERGIKRSTPMYDNNPHWSPRDLIRSRTGLALLGFLVIAGYVLITEHRAHLLVALPLALPFALPLLLLLCCALMMLMMMLGGHGERADERDHADHTDHQTTGGTN